MPAAPNTEPGPPDNIFDLYNSEAAPSSGSFLLIETRGATEWPPEKTRVIKNMLQERLSGEEVDERWHYLATIKAMFAAEQGNSLSEEQAAVAAKRFQQATQLLDKHRKQSPEGRMILATDMRNILIDYLDELVEQGNVYAVFLDNTLKEKRRENSQREGQEDNTPEVMRHLILMIAYERQALDKEPFGEAEVELRAMLS